MSTAATLNNGVTFFYDSDDTISPFEGKTTGLSSILPLFKDTNGRASVFNHDIELQDEYSNEFVDKMSENVKILSLNHMLNQIKNIELMGDSWTKEIVKGPNNFAIRLAEELSYQLNANEVFPFRITQSIEEGMCFVFKSNELFLYLEIYNDEELGLIIEDSINKKIVSNKEIPHKSEIINKIMEFYRNNEVSSIFTTR